ncbi:MAG TPA: carboxypeptidase-like regulatory domain-containing protein [Candidatus Polarisedimenticolia bacterium]|nr:carboxypeptidase-like regulatory domain-containing protein [Candidatus Polarisedimenticolia bacterium]
MFRRLVAALLVPALILLIVPSATVRAAEEQPAAGIIRGTLLDANGQPLAGYKVKVTDAGGVVHEAPPTGPDGKYEIPNLPAGTYTYQIFDPSGKVVPVRIPPIELQPGTAVTQPIAIVPRKGGFRPLAAWLIGGGAAAAAIAIAAGNDDDDDEDDAPSMTASLP